MRRRDDAIARRSLREFDVSDTLCFLSSWWPPMLPFDRERSRWLDWQSYLRDYESIRDQLLARWDPLSTGKPIFAESVRTFVQRKGLTALEAVPCSGYLNAALDDADRTR